MLRLQRPRPQGAGAKAARRKAQHWCTLGVVALLGLAAVVRLGVFDGSGDEEPATFTGAWSRRLQYWDDLIISKKCCKTMIGEDTPRATYNLAPVGEKFGVIVHIIVIGYMLLGLNTVCDAYFTGALDVMVEKWNIKPDVAGATFMAAGGSAPELFTSLIGAVVTTNDVGFGTIVGSAVFNVLFVIGLCGYAAKEPIALTWWPLFRDCTYYIFGLLMLAMLARSPNPNGCIEWWEAVLLFILYICYCTIMYFNEGLEAFIKSKVSRKGSSSKVAPDAVGDDTAEKPTNDDMLRKGASEGEVAAQVDDADAEKGSPKGSPKGADEKAAAKDDEPPETKIEKPEDGEGEGEGEGEEEEEGDDIEEMMVKPDGAINQIIWYLSLPIYGSLYYLIPKPDEKKFIYTFVVSLFWIAFYSFFLVYCVEVLGEVIGIPVVVMGFTLLAAGTSIPDLVSSVAVAKQGEGDMAVSSSIGSNIFDILVGLPVPWMLKIMVVDPARGLGMPPIPIGGFIVFYVFVLLFMVLCVIVSIHLLGWKLNKCLGLCMGLLYIVFLAVALTVEFLSISYDLSALRF